MGLLTAKEQRGIVNEAPGNLWVDRVENQRKHWTLVILEEFQTYGRNVRGELSENLLRVMSVGRNQQLRVLAITPDLSLVDPAFIRLCGQRYHGKLLPEENSKRKFRAFYGKKWCDIAGELTTGQFVYYHSDNGLSLITVPLFEPKSKPQVYRPPTLAQKIREWLR